MTTTTAAAAAATRPVFCVELTQVYSSEAADAMTAKLAELTVGCFMGFSFAACPAGGCFTVCAFSQHEDAAADARDMLLAILVEAL